LSDNKKNVFDYYIEFKSLINAKSIYIHVLMEENLFPFSPFFVAEKLYEHSFLIKPCLLLSTEGFSVGNLFGTYHGKKIFHFLCPCISKYIIL